ncbi:hypothetical protein [Acidithiobacillus caldus]|uniref:hypothetical protein n=1 Tax=Acidithiobacillus caldus TaxID=33059 RepID=UPI001C072A86|nr:hypothetical protein [Acidithiobacillus caldus]MBU2762334.1 hypothetical protein [Acidithiobacillus caldus]MBU2771831.1 hypothetical protein [Acidithiobacillus caldus]
MKQKTGGYVMDTRFRIGDTVLLPKDGELRLFKIHGMSAQLAYVVDLKSKQQDTLPLDLLEAEAKRLD